MVLDCPDCDTAMERVQFGMHGAADPYVRPDEGGGLFSPRELQTLATVACPDCGLVRWYLDEKLDDD
jgi:hypothetical protein